MLRFAGLFLAALALMGCQQSAADAQLTEQQQDEVRGIVRDYILENPEIIEEALIELQRRAREREMQDMYAAVSAQSDAIYNDARDPRVGPDSADVVVVEFMDYKCSYCRVANSWVQDIREQHGDRVQFILKEYPILGEESVQAARAALAAHRQGIEVYEAFHNAMISSSGPLPDQRIDQLARLSGVDVERMRADMEDPAILNHISQVRSLGSVLGVSGTPFFIIEGTVVPGANEMALNEALARALAD